MKIALYLKDQLIDFVESYQKYFKKTLGVALIYSLLCAIVAAFLLRFSNFHTPATLKQITLMSSFFHRYSKGNIYAAVDLTKTVFVFFVSLYSIGLTRLSQTQSELKEIPLKHFFSSIKNKDFIFLAVVFVLSSFLDYVLFEFERMGTSNSQNVNSQFYIHNTFFQLRIYLPLILFAFAVQKLTNSETGSVTLVRILFLYGSLWLFNEFAFEMAQWVRSHLFGLLLIPFSDPEKYNLFESILSIPLIAFFFPGYYSAMTKSLALTRGMIDVKSPSI